METFANIPGADVVMDPFMMSYYARKGDYENAAAYSIATAIPFAGGLTAKIGIKGFKVLSEAVNLPDFYGKLEIMTRGLTDDLVKNSREVINGVDINDKEVLKAFEEAGGELSDWGKYRTETLTGATKGDYSIHFYKNKETGEVLQLGAKAKVHGTEEVIPFD